jgi:hypothetical protein
MLVDRDEQVRPSANRDMTRRAQTYERVGQRGFPVIREGGQCKLRLTEDVVSLAGLIGCSQPGENEMCRNASKPRRIHRT